MKPTMKGRTTMKKCISILLTLTLLFALAACGGTDTPSSTSAPPSGNATATPEATETPESTTAPDETPEPADSSAVYNNGTEFAVFAIEIPSDVDVRVSDHTDRLVLDNEEEGWRFACFSIKARAERDTALEYLEDNVYSPIEECTIGEMQGYRCYMESDGRVYQVSYAFESPQGVAGTWGYIEIKSLDSAADCRLLPDLPSIKAILGSVRAPE
jgi:predicted small lipoprotein YifL